MPDKIYHHGDLKSELIREGLKILDADGYDGFTLRKVAKACNVSQTAPYRHYKNKDELIAAITLYAMEAFDKRLKDAVTLHPDDPAGQLQELGLAYISFFTDNPEYLRLLFLSGIQQRIREAGIAPDGCKNTGLHLHQDHPFSTLTEAVDRYKNARPDLKMNRDELMLSCWGLVHGISSLIAAGELPAGPDMLKLADKTIRSWIV